MGWRRLGTETAFETNPLPVIMSTLRSITAVFLEDAPIEISTIEELQRIGQDPTYPLHWDYLLTNDIDASATADWDGGFEPIGASHVRFTGTLDGQGHVVYGLTIDRPGKYYVGLFGRVKFPGEISNVGIEGGTVAGNAYVGALIGTNGGTVGQSFAHTEVTGGCRVGGLVGGNGGTVTNCHATGAVTVIQGDRSYAGGLAGGNSGTLTRCYATGAVYGVLAIGGLLGENDGMVEQCFATGAVTDTTNSAD